MHDGWEFVVAAYGVTAVTLGAWFGFILRKLARQRRQREQR
jgi:hypothetical protein